MTRWLDGLLQDLRYGLRLARRQPALTLAVTATLALGVGANTAVFSVVDAVLLRPLPYGEPDRLVAGWESSPERQAPDNEVSSPSYLDGRVAARSFGWGIRDSQTDAPGSGSSTTRARSPFAKRGARPAESSSQAMRSSVPIAAAPTTGFSTRARPA